MELLTPGLREINVGLPAVPDDSIRALFGWNLTDEEVETKRFELADFAEIVVTLALENIVCRKP